MFWRELQNIEKNLTTIVVSGERAAVEGEFNKEQIAIFVEHGLDAILARLRRRGVRRQHQKVRRPNSRQVIQRIVPEISSVVARRRIRHVPKTELRPWLQTLKFPKIMILKKAP